MDGWMEEDEEEEEEEDEEKEEEGEEKEEKKRKIKKEDLSLIKTHLLMNSSMCALLKW